MDTLPRLFLAARFLLLCLAALLLPSAADAQQVLSVTPTSVSVQTTFGTNAASQTVRVANSGRAALKWTVVQSTSGWVTVSPSNGVNSGTLTLTFKTTTLAASTTPYSTTFTVNSNGGSQQVTVQVLVKPAATLTVTCPANITAYSSNGSAIPVTYTATVSGGVNASWSGLPGSGSNFPVGTTNVLVTAVSDDGQKANCGFTVTVKWLLVVTCPSNITVTSSNGSPVAVTYTATVSGGVNASWSGLPASGSNFPVGTTNVLVTAQSDDGQTATCGFTVTVNTSSNTLVVTCPANISVASSDGNPVVVSYTVTTTGGVPPVTLNVTPASGSSFPVGSTLVSATAQSSDGQTANCEFWVIVSYQPPSSSSVGPQSTITCPAGAVNILPGTNNIQAQIDGNAAGTTFCLKAGPIPFSVTHPLTPKSNDTFIGEFGAVLDGTGWDQTDTDTTHCAFRAYQQDIDFVTIRNLVIRNMRQCAILAFYQNSNNWTIEFNEINANNAGIIFPSNSLIRNNFIHNNYNLGYQADSAHNSTVENNEISYNGYEQKIIQSANVIFRGNFIHHNEGAGIWYDSDNTGALIENNRIEDNHGMGIFYEVSGTATIRNNTVRRSGDTGIFISTSRDNEVYGNTLDSNFRGITYLVNCPSVGGGSIFFDLTNNSTHDNTIVVGTQSGAFASAFASVNCNSTQVAAYQIPPGQNGSHNLTFTHNSYDVPSPTTVKYWFYFDVMKLFTEWQLLGLDTTGSVQ